MSKVQISSTIIAYNESQKIGRCIRSLQGIADEIVLVDSGSTDDTCRIAEDLGARILERTFDSYIQQKNYASQQAVHSVILSLDADEELSDQLRASLLKVKSAWQADAYEMNRLNNYCGQWIRHGGWYPDRQLRLYDKRKGTWAGKRVHERVVMQANTTKARLNGDLLHYTIDSSDQHQKQIERFTSLAALDLFEAGKRSSPFRQYLKPPAKFLFDFIFKAGFLDGSAGYHVCKNSAWSRHLRYKKLAKLWRDNHGT